MSDIPPELFQGDRVADPHFEPKERLYRRLRRDWGDAPDIDAIQLPDISVNRGKYCEPIHVLWSESGAYEGWGVLCFRVKDVPAKVAHAGIELYTSKIVHTPQRKNYPHSEVRAYDPHGSHLDSKSIAMMDRGANLRFRQKTLEYAQVIIEPAPSLE
jgi:hypothetical protein